MAVDPASLFIRSSPLGFASPSSGDQDPDSQFSHDASLLPDSWQGYLDVSGDVSLEGFWNAGLFEPSPPAPSELSAAEHATSSNSVPDRSRDNLPPKIGARFSRDSVQVLRRWLALNSRHPYPTDEDKAMLQRQTGLNKTQISNWLTNARRKRNAESKKSSVAQRAQKSTAPIDVPHRPGTPAPRSSLHDNVPLRRWVDSPPEDEAASIHAIARAITPNWSGPSSSDQLDSVGSTEDTAARSLYDGSSLSSVGTLSGSSFASTHSSRSGASLGPFHSTRRPRNYPRRRNRTPATWDERSSLTSTAKPYQCTFCTETFKTKHDWQRHEKSLHLSLEMWRCAPDGPQVVNPRTNQVCCVFCGKVDRDPLHAQYHNYSACKTSHNDKVFYRKDHLIQHLKLVHGVQFLDWCMKTWKVSTAEVRSRCGFCGITMHSWQIRVEHLAEHFKTGKTLADWKGDWGFEAPVLEMLKNAIPPYLIEMDRSSPFPFVAICTPAESPRTAYELITSEIEYFIVNNKESMCTFLDEDSLRFEACRVIFASEALSSQGISSESSWFRDLLMASEDITQRAQFAPIRWGIENKFCVLKINGKDNLFEQCPLEQRLHEFVQSQTLLGLPVTDADLQKEACHIITRIEEASMSRSDGTVNWLIQIIRSSTEWLAPFRQRAHLPKSSELVSSNSYLGISQRIESGAQSHDEREQFLGQHLEVRRVADTELSNKDLGREAGRIIEQANHTRGSTVADNIAWLNGLNHGQTQSLANTSGTGYSTLPEVTTPGPQQHDNSLSKRISPQPSGPQAFEAMMKDTFLNDTNCYRRVVQELTRFVRSTMSPNNPNRHVPTDAELQHQARWILFDSDDPWNQTAADNDEWLQRFKRNVGVPP